MAYPVSSSEVTMRERFPPHLQPFSRYILAEPPARRLVRRLLGVICLLLWLLVSAMIVIVQDNIRFNRTPVSIFQLEAISLFGAFCSVVLLILLGALFARSAESRLKADQRLPVLYLRSFLADRMLPERWHELLLLVFRWTETAESDLARALRPIGPLIAVGRPGEILPPVGAARLYVDHENWQQTVAELSKLAQLIVLRIGKTEGFSWEWKFVRENCDPQKVLIYLPPSDSDLYREFASTAGQASLPTSLPFPQEKAAFLAFRSDWSAILVNPDGPSKLAFFRQFILGGSRAPGIYEGLRTRIRRSERPLGLGWREWCLSAAWCIAALWLVSGVYGKIAHTLQEIRMAKASFLSISYKNGENRCRFATREGSACWDECDDQKKSDSQIKSCICFPGSSPLFQMLCGGGTSSEQIGGVPILK